MMILLIAGRRVAAAAGAMLILAGLACAASPSAASPDTRATSRATTPKAAKKFDVVAKRYVIEEIELTAQPAMAIRGQVRPDELHAELGTVIPRLVAHVFTTGLQLSGPPFVRYHARSARMIEYEAGVPVLKPGPEKGDIKPIELPRGPAVATVHVGPYEGLPGAYDALAAWAGRHHREAGGPGWDVFLTNPLQEPEPKNWRTKVFLPLKPGR